ncbi:MAG: flagellar hook-basal body complex protein, partial [Desulfovibrio sp.]|nr:flagellar hook-basal body complex protein [Desulfovibrio sp.]
SRIFRFDASRTLNTRATTNVGDVPGAIYASHDGYAEGHLLYMDVTQGGIVRATYNNGQSQDLYQVVLYRFTSQDGLRNEGNNHYSATPEAGQIQEGLPGQENFGTIEDYSLEQSNVDYAREFSHMIIIQRGFQMNSKVITTSDTMLQRALELKR